MVDHSDITLEMFLTPEQQHAYATFRQQVAERLAGLKAQFQREQPALRISYDVSLAVTVQSDDLRKPGTPVIVYQPPQVCQECHTSQNIILDIPIVKYPDGQRVYFCHDCWERFQQESTIIHLQE